ncbi:MAG: type II toxin-antitoxin system HipA family toxin [Mailhella sp.]|nr:type II toxin-antitoxin system HipA family toxin [Mailhella sp.]
MRVRVFLNHLGMRTPVGILVQTAQGILFEYHSEFLERGIPLSPYFLPLRPGTFFDDKQTFDGLFGVFNDSLPDGWGLLLLDRALAKKGRSLAQASPLERLTFIGSNAMGALEYEPDASANEDSTVFDLDTLAEESRRILGEREYHGELLDDLLRLNGSLAGARPKIMLSIPDESGTLQPWIIKFRALEDRPDAGLVEYQHSVAARMAGLDMPETRLFPSKNGAGYFGIKRFDRRDGLKIHTHTACGLLHASHRFPSLDYENLIRLTASLTQDKRDVERMVRLMIFNVKSGNQDDHSKNFSFCMDTEYRWHLSPAYDLTPCTGINGEHCSTVNGKGKDITDADLIKAAAVGGIGSKKVKEMIEQVVEALGEIPRS